MTGEATGAAAAGYAGSRFSEVRAQLLSDPYQTLPQHKVTIGSMFRAGKNLLFGDASTLLGRDADIVPYMQKLLHANGICFFGRWKITEETPYTGCFRTGTEHLIVTRCSTLLSHTDRGTRRGFGLAGKIFPTLDPNRSVRTANFITIDVLGGTMAKRYTDVALTNQPAFGPNFGLLPLALAVANVIYVFARADASPDYRPLTQLVETGLLPGETPMGPKWMQLAAEQGIGKSDAVDFREELRLANYRNGQLRFTISAADTAVNGQRQWRPIGVIELTEEACSDSGDHRIRFRHYPNRLARG